MSLPISISNSTPYTYPVGFSVGASADVCSAASTIINNYTTIRNNLYSQLYGIFKTDPASIGSNTFPLKIADFIKDVCVDSDAANQAYKFYGCKIINQINRLQDYINQATELKAALEACTTADAAHEKVVRLQILFQWCEEITDEFSMHYIYDFAEDAWKISQDDYQSGKPTQFSDDFANSFDNLHNKTVDSTPASTPAKTIEVFNELNLLDRLKYIKLYYDVEAGNSEYVFPEGDKSIGYPCEKTEQEEYVAALEKFFIGYLVDRDGPVNAMSAFLDIKVTALRGNIQLLAKQIEAYNTYLKFLRCGLERFQESQCNGYNRIPDGAVIALTYFAGNPMYNLVEVNNEKYLLLTSVRDNTMYFLVKADEQGINFLIGTNGSANDCVGDGYCHNSLLSSNNNRWRACHDGDGFLAIGSVGIENQIPVYPSESNRSPGTISLASLPKKLDVQTIDPCSVKQYSEIGKKADEATVTSWTDAFNTKTKYIDTAIETCNTDIQLLRKKIDTLDTLSSTLRRRIQDVYQKNLSKIPK